MKERILKDHPSSSDEESEDDVMSLKHSNLLNAIASLDEKKRKKDIERLEPAHQVSEYNIVAKRRKVHLNELIKDTQDTQAQGALKTQLSRVQKSNKKLDVPLHALAQERLERGIAYETTSKDITVWDPIVMKNRQADQMQFPLEKPELRLHTATSKMPTFQPRTPLEMEIAAVLQGNDHVLTQDRILTPSEEKALKAMSLQEAKERRKELQKYRALLSYKETKERRQKKIKSKKYHRILRKDKEKELKKKLEEQEKNDPEAFLEHLQDVEKNRMMERMSLKHKAPNSKFMRRQAIYGKYDDKSRQAIQDMVEKSKELRTKLKAESESDSDDNDDVHVEELEENSGSKHSSLINPWMAGTSIEGQQERESYRRPRAVVQKHNDNIDVDEVVNETDVKDYGGKFCASIEEPSEFLPSKQKNVMDDLHNKQGSTKHAAKIEHSRKSYLGSDSEMTSKYVITESRERKDSINSSDSDEDSDVSIDNLFDELSKKKKEKVIPILKDVVKKNRRSKRGERLGKDDIECVQSEGLSSSLRRKQTLEDLEDSNWSDDGEGKKSLSEISQRVAADEKVKMKEAAMGKKITQEYINPKKVLAAEKRIKPTHLPAYVDNEDSSTDEEAREEQHQLTIAEAFASDDVIESFKNEKKSVADQEKAKNIDLTLPGWGDWGGSGTKPISKKKKKRFIIKAPPRPPRRDKSLGNVIISEAKDSTISKYQVSSLPFPFTSVSNFESSIRNPIGKNWNTEASYKNLIKPKVVTRLGTIIDPISKEETFSKEKDYQVEKKTSKKINRRKSRNTSG